MKVHDVRVWQKYTKVPHQYTHADIALQSRPQAKQNKTKRQETKNIIPQQKMPCGLINTKDTQQHLVEKLLMDQFKCNIQMCVAMI